MKYCVSEAHVLERPIAGLQVFDLRVVEGFDEIA